ncbi:MAG: hypothetical protein ACR2J8_05465 [Thermomicrobiales bacterium]
MDMPIPDEVGEIGLSYRVAGQLAHLRALFGNRYDERQWRAIEKELIATANKALKLRTVPLTNGDEPEIVFAPARLNGGAR